MLISGLKLVATGVGVDDVDLLHHVQIFFGGQGGVDIGDARIKTGTEQRHDSGIFEPLLIGPLPGIFKLRGVQRLVVSGVKIVNAGFKTGIHDGQILVGKRHVDHQLRLHLFDQGDQFRHVIRVYLCRCNTPPQLGGDGVAFGFGPRSKGNVGKNVAPLGTFVGDNLADTAGPDNKDVAHIVPFWGESVMECA